MGRDSRKDSGGMGQGSQSELSESSRWATGTQLHWRHLSGRVEHAPDLSHRGPRRLNSVSTNSQLSMVEGSSGSILFWAVWLVFHLGCAGSQPDPGPECRGPRKGDVGDHDSVCFIHMSPVKDNLGWSLTIASSYGSTMLRKLLWPRGAWNYDH